MFIDNNLVLADSQSLTVSGASSNYIDTLAAGDGITDGAWFFVLIKTAVTGGTSVEFDLQTDSDPAFGTAVVLFSTGAIVVASLTANTYIAKVRIPLGAKRYIRGYVTIVGPISTGSWDMKIVEDPQRDVNGIGKNIN
jgi:hypothetical protein